MSKKDKPKRKDETMKDNENIDNEPETKKPGREKVDVQEAYKEYVSRMEKRIKSGEKLKDGNPLEIKPFEKWVRKAKRIEKETGNEIEVEVSGDTGETKNERFIRLGRLRMNNALETLDTIENLATSQYASTPDQRKKMLDTLKAKITSIENSFSKIKAESQEFSF